MSLVLSLFLFGRPYLSSFVYGHPRHRGTTMQLTYFGVGLLDHEYCFLSIMSEHACLFTLGVNSHGWRWYASTELFTYLPMLSNELGFLK